MILPFLNLDLSPTLDRHFLPYQINWIEAEDSIHTQKLQAFALAENPWTYADAFKNVRKRLSAAKIGFDMGIPALINTSLQRGAPSATGSGNRFSGLPSTPVNSSKPK